MRIDSKTSAHSHIAEKFRIAVEAASNAMIIINQEGKIELVNTEAEDLFGYSKDELVGESIETLVPEQYRMSHLEDRKTFFKNPNARTMGGGRDLLGRRKDGVEVNVEIGLKPIETDEGLFVAASLINISERIRNTEELRRTTAELRRSNAELEQFAYVASHDLQEPLRAIEGCAQLLRERYLDKLGSLGEKLITHTIDGVVRMQALIDDLLTFSRLETRDNLLEHTDCAAVLEIVLTNLSATKQKAEAEITHDALPNILADKSQLIQLFQNLISNALKFCGDRNPRIHIAAVRKRDGWLFSVSDNGIGIEPRYFERIFHVFQRLHTRREYPGTGIGLAVCKKIVQRHGGQIWVESEPGKGSIFYFNIPKNQDLGQMNFEF